MKQQIYLIILLINVGCFGQAEKSKPQNSILESKTDLDSIKQPSELAVKKIESLQELNVLQEQESYIAVKRSIENERSQLKSKNLSPDSLKHIFEIALLHKVIPFWEGTEWSFEGHTSKPQQGRIACGYFVSTTLRDIGLNLNRYKLAQQSPVNEASSLAIDIDVKEFSEGSTQQNISAINAHLKEGIHFIGFDQSHVGYILKEQGSLYLIHSNYLDAKGVEIESIEISEVFNSYGRFYIVELSSNENLIRNWINGSQVQIVTNG